MQRCSSAYCTCWLCGLVHYSCNKVSAFVLWKPAKASFSQPAPRPLCHSLAVKPVTFTIGKIPVPLEFPRLASLWQVRQPLFFPVLNRLSIILPSPCIQNCMEFGNLSWIALEPQFSNSALYAHEYLWFEPFNELCFQRVPKFCLTLLVALIRIPEAK